MLSSWYSSEDWCVRIFSTIGSSDVMILRYSGASSAVFRLSVQPMVIGICSSDRLSVWVSFHNASSRSAMGIKSAPFGVRSTCLSPFFRTISGKLSSSSSDLSRWLTVGCERNRRSAVLVMLPVETMVRKVSISARFMRQTPFHTCISIVQQGMEEEQEERERNNNETLHYRKME